MFIKIIKNNRKGFTMIELLIALGVFTVGIMAAFTLSLSNIKIAKENYDRTLAANLAREGIELVRNIRDSNWLKVDANVLGSSWDKSLNGRDDQAYIINYDDDPLELSIVSNGCQTIDDCMSFCSGNGTCSLYKNAAGFYDYDNGGTPTNMYRLITLKNICFDTGSGAEAAPAHWPCADELAGFQVTTRVQWERNGETNHLDVVEYMYNWRR